MYGDVDRTIQRSGVTHTSLRLPDAAALQTLTTTVLVQVSSQIDAYCDRDFAVHEITETRNGTGRSTFRLLHYPVIEIDTLTADGVVLTEGTDYVVSRSGIVERIGTTWRQARRNIEITYTYGYETTPAAVVGICEDIVANALGNVARNVAAKGASSMSMDGYSVAYSELSRVAMLAPEQTAILDRYRRIGGA